MQLKPDGTQGPNGPNNFSATPSVKVDVEQRSGEVSSLSEQEACLEVENMNFYYGDVKALNNINITIPERKVTAFIGPSGCGKSTLIRIFNRMNDLIDGTRLEGSVRLKGTEIYDPYLNVADLRRRVGMVFHKPNPFPKSIYENVSYGLRIQGINNRAILNATVEKALKGAALWEEAKD